MIHEEYFFVICHLLNFPQINKNICITRAYRTFRLTIMQSAFMGRLFAHRSHIVTSLRFASFHSRHLPRYLLRMNEAFLRYENGSDVFDITFRYMDEATMVDRQFNFSRQITESVNKFLSRIDVNVCKIINKKVRDERECVLKMNVDK